MWRNTFKLLTSRHIFSLISSSLFSLNYDQTETWWLIIATSFVDGKHQSVCRHWAALSIAFRRQVGSYLLKYTYIPAYWYVHIHIYMSTPIYIYKPISMAHRLVPANYGSFDHQSRRTVAGGKRLTPKKQTSPNQLASN